MLHLVGADFSSLCVRFLAGWLTCAFNSNPGQFCLLGFQVICPPLTRLASAPVYSLFPCFPSREFLGLHFQHRLRSTSYGQGQEYCNPPCTRSNTCTLSLSTGTYIITALLRWRKPIVLRGAGIKETTLKFPHSKTDLWVGGVTAGFEDKRDALIDRGSGGQWGLAS